MFGGCGGNFGVMGDRVMGVLGPPGLLLPPESSLGVFIKKRFELRSDKPEPIPEPISTIPEPIPDPISTIPDPIPDPISTMPDPIPEPMSTMPEPIEPMPDPMSDNPDPISETKFLGELFVNVFVK